MTLRRVYTTFTEGASTVVVQWRARQVPGLVQSIRVALRWAPTVRAGIGQTLAPIRLAVLQRQAVRQVVSVVARWSPTARPAVRQGTRALLTPRQNVRAAPKTVTYNLTATWPAASVTPVTTAGTAWANPANAVGAANGTLASHPGSLTAAQAARLHLFFPAPFTKTALTVTKVEVLFWYSITGTVLANGDVQLTYGTVANPFATLLTAPITGDANTLTVPQVFDLTPLLPNLAWSTIADLAVAVRHDAAAAELHVCNVDAVALRITATTTQTV